MLVGVECGHVTIILPSNSLCSFVPCERLHSLSLVLYRPLFSHLGTERCNRELLPQEHRAGRVHTLTRGKVLAPGAVAMGAPSRDSWCVAHKCEARRYLTCKWRTSGNSSDIVYI